ncbi:MAG TPA: DUF1592 domain-containing protein, partial [Blastocatellia bacterium]
MKKRRLQLGLVVFISGLAIIYSGSTSRAQRSNTLAQRTLIEENCVYCHNQKSKTAGVSLEGLNFNNVGENAALWERVLRKVRTGQMPPPGAPELEASDMTAFVNWLEGSLDRAARLNPNPGRPAVHRLNRTEYSNAIRDLLAVDIKPGAALPVDDSGYGFDNIGEVLTISPALLEKYISMAHRVSRLAVGDPSVRPSEERFQPRRMGRNERVSDDLPFYSRGGLSFQYYFPLDGEYLIRIKTPANVNIGAPAGFYEMRAPVKAGLRTVGVTYPREDAKADPMPPGMRFGGPPALASMGPQKIPLDLWLDGAKIKRFEVSNTTPIDVVTVSGPFNVNGRGATPSRARIFICRPAGENEESACAKQILAALTRLAFRRPVTDADLNPLLAFYERGRRERDFDYGVQSAIEAMLVSPDFLFRVERDPKTAAPGAVYRINDFELASRLSFFLWSSIPDDELLNLAEKGRLKNPAVLRQQTRRMLDDPRSQAFISNFGGQWLHLRNLDT